MNKNFEGNRYEENVLSFIPNGQFYFTKGIKAFQRNDLLNAKKYLNRAWQFEPNEPIIACQLAIALAELEEYDRSNEILYQIINELDPYMYECYYFLANNFAYLGMYKDAVRNAKLYLKNEPDGEFAQDTFDLLEVISFESEEPSSFGDEPLQDEEELIDKQEQARLLLAEGKFTDAIEFLQEMIEQYPEHWPAYNNLALAYYYNGDKEMAIDMVMAVLENNNGNLHAICNLTVFCYYEGINIHPLVESLKKIHPISADHRYKLGVTFTIVGEYELGFKWLRTIIGANYSVDASFYYWLAYAAHYVNKPQLAKKAWKKLLLLQPDKKGNEPWNHDNNSNN